MSSTLYLGLAGLFGMLMTWGIGANDLANVMSTTMGSESLSLRRAIGIALIFEFAGALFGGTQVTETIRSGLLDVHLLQFEPHLIIYGMLATLLAGTTWMLIASFVGMPVSVTNAIVGALVGFTVAVFGVYAVHWRKVGLIALSWILSPAIAGAISYTLIRSIQRLVLEMAQPMIYVLRYFPVYLFLVGLVLANMIVVKGLYHFSIDVSHALNIKIGMMVSLLLTLIGYLYAKRIHVPSEASLREQFQYVEHLFSLLVIMTTCAMVFAHGSNDVAIAVGPIAAVFSVTQGHITQQNPLPIWVIAFATSGVILGLVMYGRKVITTVGSRITTLTPSRAFAATLAASVTVIISTGTGIPVSATQTLVGAVLGVGLARGIGALNMTVIRNIFMSWVVTIPVASTLAILYFYLFKATLPA